MNTKHLSLILVFLSSVIGFSAEKLADTLTPLAENQPPAMHPHPLWWGWDPSTEPLDTEVLHEWEEEGVILKVVRFRVGVFKGQKAMLAGVYGYPKGGRNLPGLLNIHGGGQYADYRSCLTNAKRGYATLSIAWAGRISAPNYTVGPKEVKLFWEGKTQDPSYKVTTDWGALDAYHAPSKHGKDAFHNIPTESWTIDPKESARNNSWFVVTMGARRGLTFLEKQHGIVDRSRLGVYGHSMGGKLTVLTASNDTRVKAAAPSCGGVSDRYSENKVHLATVSDLANLQRLKCPILFLNPVNDFHANFQDFATIPQEVPSQDIRYSFAPQLNHQDIPQHAVAALKWMDEHLKFDYEMPKTPQTAIELTTINGIPQVTVTPDATQPIKYVDVYYTQQGVAGATQKQRELRTNRHWHHARTVQDYSTWIANLPISDPTKPIWFYANVTYALPAETTGAGYYYNVYQTDEVTISSVPTLLTAEQIQAANLQPTLASSDLIESFNGDWKKEWFGASLQDWRLSTHKLGLPHYAAPEQASLAIDVKSAAANTLCLTLDKYYAEIPVAASRQWETYTVTASQFKNASGQALANFQGVKTLGLKDKGNVREGDQVTTYGKAWKGAEPQLRDLRWQTKSVDTPANDYRWTTDHMHIGVRWQPFGSLPECNANDFQRDVLSQDSSYVQFWVAWPAIEPTPEYCDYSKKKSGELQAIEQAVDLAKAAGKKVEFVFYFAPAWATENGQSGGFKPKDGLFPEYVRRIATHFKGRVDAYQPYHEANLEFMMEGATIDFLLNEVFLGANKVIREVYGDTPVLISTSGCSPCQGCPPVKGLDIDGAKGAEAVSNYYDAIINHKELINSIDALNMNVSDQNDGTGAMDGAFMPSTWGNYDLARAKLDFAGLYHKPIISSESWITWDGGSQAYDVNGDGLKNELDAYHKTITIMGQCLERGLNTMNLPWSDNSSSWAMGLTKRVDYNGRVHDIKPGFTYPALDGGDDVITRKLATSGPDDSFKLSLGTGDNYTAADYSNPGDPNHLHYYIWRWYSQIAGGSDEVIRHALAGDHGNDIAVIGHGYTGHERYKISSYNRTKKQFQVLLYASGACGREGAYTKLAIPAKIQEGRYYNTKHSKLDFRGEGLEENAVFKATITTKDICKVTGRDINVRVTEASGRVKNGMISFNMHPLQPFTSIVIK